MNDDDYKDEVDAIYQERPRSMVMAYLDMKMEIAKVRGRTSRGAYVVTLQAFETAAAMLGDITNSITGERKYDCEDGVMKKLLAELKLIKVPKVTVKAKDKYTIISIGDVGEWHVTKNTEEKMMEMIENERYDVPFRDATALLTKVEMLLYHEEILDPKQNMESQAEMEWLARSLAFDINTMMLEGEDAQE